MMKLTKKIALEAAMNAVENSTLPNWSYTTGDETLEINKTDLLEKLGAMLTEVEKRAATAKTKPTGKQQENRYAASELLRVMTSVNEPKTITDLLKLGAFPDGISNQKAYAIMKLLVDDGKVERTIDKRKAYFALVK